MGNQFFCQRTPHTLGNHHIAAQQFHARLEVILGLTFPVQAEHAGHHAMEGTIFTENQLTGGKAWIYLNPQTFRLFGKPTAQIAKRGCVAAMIIHQFGHEEIGQAYASGWTQHQKTVLGYGVVQGAIFCLPIGNEIIQRNRVHHRTRKDMGTNF